MKKRILSLLTLLCMVTALLPANITAFAATSGYYTYTISNGEATITDCDTSISGNVTIPSKLGNYPVTTIGKWAFLNCDKITSLTIPDSITVIEDEAFNNCWKLSNVNLGKSLTKIGSYAFIWCALPCDIYIPASLVNIDEDAFGYGPGRSEIQRFIVDENNPIYASLDGNLVNKDRTEFIQYAGINKKVYEIPNGIETIDARAFYFHDEIEKLTIPNSVKKIKSDAFFYCKGLKDVFYNGTKSDWDNVLIINSDDYLIDATRTYFAYINIFDKDGNKVVDTTQKMDETLDISKIDVPENNILKLYKNKELTEEYSLDTPISENLNLYYDIIELNKLKITGTESADIGQKGITESVTFATDKTANDFVATIKYSDKLNLSAITEKDFSITENLSETKNGYTYLYLTCTYKNDGNMPKNTTLNPFDLVFDVSESATANEKLTIEFVSDDNDETYLALGSTGYDFDSLGKAEIKVNPILVKSITINGTDEIDKATQYTAAISPENATNKEIEWSVDNSDIATISADGILTPIKAGTVKITATAKDESGISGEKSVNVKVYATITSLSANIGVWDKTFTSSEREYTIYVPKNTSIIKIKPTHNSNGELKGTTTLTNGRNNNFSLTDTETVLTLAYSQTGYTDSEYKIKIVKFEGTKTTVSEDGKTFTVKPINIASGNTVILALYNGDKLAEVQSAVYSGENIHFMTSESYTKAKVFVWGNLTDIIPICDVEIVK